MIKEIDFLKKLVKTKYNTKGHNLISTYPADVIEKIDSCKSNVESFFLEFANKMTDEISIIEKYNSLMSNVIYLLGGEITPLSEVNTDSNSNSDNE